MTDEVIIAFASLGLAWVLTLVKSSNDVARLKERINQIEKKEERVEEALIKLSDSIQKIERALVKAGYINVE